MLAIEPAQSRRAGVPRLAIALAGGGPLGAFYELGALHALSEALEGRSLTDFDVYVGVSSGALIAAGLANGFDTTRLGSTFIRGESTDAPFSPSLLLRPAIATYARRLPQLPEVLGAWARNYLREPLQAPWPAAVAALEHLVPTAIFDNGPLERYLRDVFSQAGHSNDFRRLRAQLFVVATNLNTGDSVAFGAPGQDAVPISRAVVASAALPGLYPAVQIGGHQYVDGALIRTMHASLALEAGCELVICINPLVPFDASRARRRGAHGLTRKVSGRGIATLLGQTFRALIHSRMQIGMATYRDRFPRADTLLIEPDRYDERFFFANVFRYSGRQQLAEHAYQRTRRDLLRQAGPLREVLRARGLGLDMRILRDTRRTFATAGRERQLEASLALTRLDAALTRLEGHLAAAPSLARP